MKHNTTYVNCNTGFISCVRNLWNGTRNNVRVMVFLALVFCLTSAFGQTPPPIEWQKTFGGTGIEYAHSLIQTADGGYATAGWTSSNNGDVTGIHSIDTTDFWVVKMSSTGQIEWQKTLGGTRRDEAYSIIQTRDGGYAVAGYTASNNGDVSGYYGGGDFWVVKLSSTGQLEWQKTLGGTSTDIAYSLVQTVDGGYAVAGQTLSNDGDVSGNHGGGDFWVMKLSSIGQLEWQKTLGGTGEDFACSLIQTAEGGYAVAGRTISNDGDVSGNHG